MPDKSALAAALLGRADAPEAVDLLWRCADENIHGAKVAPRPELALRLALEGSVDVAIKIATVTEDPTVLDTLARKDNRKKVKLAVSQNTHARIDTLEHLLGWAMRPGIQHDQMITGILTRGLPWDRVHAVLLARGASLPGVYARQVDSLWSTLVRRSLEAGLSSFQELLARGWDGFFYAAIQHYRFQGSTKTLTVTDLLAGQKEDMQRKLILQILQDCSRDVTKEVLEIFLALLPGWTNFPSNSFLRSSMTLTLPLDGIELLVQNASGATGHITDALLASATDLEMDVWSPLLERRPEYLVRYCNQLRLTDADRAELLRLGDLHNARLHQDGTRMVHPLWIFASGSSAVDNHTANRILDDVLAESAKRRVDERFLKATQKGDLDKRLAVLRTLGNWEITQKWLPLATSEEVLSLLAEPGAAFSTTTSSSRFNAPSVTTSPRSSADHVAHHWSFFQKLSCIDEIVATTPGLLTTTVGTSERVLDCLQAGLGEHWESPAALDILLSFAPMWDRTVPELAELVVATIS